MKPSAVWAPVPSLDAAEFSPTFAALGVRHAFAIRQAGIDTNLERVGALLRLAPAHAALRVALGFGGLTFCTAEQVHGAEVALVDRHASGPAAGVDALLTNDPSVCLGIYAADCCAVFLADPLSGAVALVHSGLKGTRLGVVPRTLQRMREVFGSSPPEMTALLSPCIRPPHFETDFAAEIRGQLLEAGVGSVWDAGLCTASHPERYYSYRRELGKTGRMLALLSCGAVGER